MTTRLHAPGPFSYEAERMHIKDGGGASIAAILGEGTEADGLLFAAAPNLLAALKDMLTFGAELDSNGYAVRSRAEAAIAKTEGR